MDSNFLEHAVRSSLVDLLEKPVLCVLRDGKKIFGTLICFDQFCNVVLKDALRREIVEKKFSDIDIGLFIVRGENVALIGELVSFAKLRIPLFPSPSPSPFPFTSPPPSPFPSPPPSPFPSPSPSLHPHPHPQSHLHRQIPIPIPSPIYVSNV